MSQSLRRMFTGLIVLAICMSTAEFCLAQSARYELGRRLKKFELSWQSSSPDQRPLSTSSMESAVERFFGLQLAEAGRALDEARTRLEKHPSDSSQIDPKSGSMTQWVDSLSLVVQPLLADSDCSELRLQLKPFYKVPYDPKPELTAQLHIYAAGNKPINWGAARLLPELELTDRRKSLSIEALEAGITESISPLPEGDYWVQVFISDSTGKHEAGRCMISRVQSLDERLNRLKADAPNPRQSTEAATVRHLTAILDSLKREQIQEIDYPAFELIQQAEALLEENVATEVKKNRSPLAADFSGTAWLRLNGKKNTAVIRIYIPPQEISPQGIPPHKQAAPSEREKHPVLFAFHGAGGSENMFFETYGAGRVVELAAARGWIVVAPRQSLIGGIGLTAREQLEILKNYLPVDEEQIYFVGHSMGAGQLIQQVQASPDLPIAAAALGGGQRVGPYTKNGKGNWFVGAGEKDFGKRGALALRTALEQNGHDVTWREYEDVEHMVVVQAALDDVFEFFDKSSPQPRLPPEPSQENPK